MKKRKSPLGIVLYIAIVSLLLWSVLGIFDMGGNELTESQLLELFRKEQVQSFEVQDHTITVNLHNPYQGKNTLTTDLADVNAFTEKLISVGAIIQ